MHSAQAAIQHTKIRSETKASRRHEEIPRLETAADLGEHDAEGTKAAAEVNEVCIPEAGCADVNYASTTDTRTPQAAVNHERGEASGATVREGGAFKASAAEVDRTGNAEARMPVLPRIERAASPR